MNNESIPLSLHTDSSTVECVGESLATSSTLQMHLTIIYTIDMV